MRSIDTILGLEESGANLHVVHVLQKCEGLAPFPRPEYTYTRSRILPLALTILRIRHLLKQRT